MLFGPAEESVLYLIPGKYVVGVRMPDWQDRIEIAVDANRLSGRAL